MMVAVTRNLSREESSGSSSQQVKGPASKGVGSSSYVITGEKEDGMGGTQIYQQPQRQEVRGLLRERWGPRAVSPGRPLHTCQGEPS